MCHGVYGIGDLWVLGTVVSADCYSLFLRWDYASSGIIEFSAYMLGPFISVWLRRLLIGEWGYTDLLFIF